MVIAAVVMREIADVISNAFGEVYVSGELSATAIWVATGIGILLPIVSAVLPIKQAIGSNLRDALDVRRSAVKGTIIRIEEAKKGKPSFMFVLAGALLTIYCFGAYYYLPYSTASSSTLLFYDLVLIIMIGMIIGLALLSLNVQPILESILIRVLLRTILFWENKALGVMVRKNLVAHRQRNQKTTIT